MKTLKKFVTALLSLAMVVLFVVPAFAQQGDYSITINNTNANHTYTAYQIFKGDVSGGAAKEPADKDAGTITGQVLSNIEWGTGVTNTAALITALKSVEGFTALSDNATAADVAKLLTSAELVDSFMTLINGETSYLGTASGSDKPEAAESSATITLSEAGYYLVIDSYNGTDGFVSDYIVQVLGKETISPKGDSTYIEKKVYEESFSQTPSKWGNGYNDVADYDIGDSVKFKLVVPIPDMTGYDGYDLIISDTLTNMTLNNDLNVFVADSKAATTGTDLNPGEDYTLTTTNIGDVSFRLSFDDIEDNKQDFVIGKFIIVTYSATIANSAEIGLDGNPNTVTLQYSNNPNDLTSYGESEDTVVVFTYELDGSKIDGANPDTKLAGAQFVLLNSDGSEVASFDTNGKFAGWKQKPEDSNWSGLEDDNTKVILISKEDGTFGISGIDEGTYKLREIAAPEGYNKLDGDKVIVITASTDAPVQNYDGTATTVLTALTIRIDQGEAVNGILEDGTVTATVANNKGTTLPETGGVGTTLFITVGGVLVLVAGVLLIVRYRMKEDN